MSAGLLHCFYCPSVEFRTWDKLYEHLTKQCVPRFQNHKEGTWPCGNCTKEYSEKRSLRWHVIKTHVPHVPPIPPRPTLSSNLSSSPSPCCPPSPYRTPDKVLDASQFSMMSPAAGAKKPQPPVTLKDVEVYLRDQFSALVAAFHSNPGMTEKTVQNFVDSFHCFQQDILYIALHRLLDHFVTTNQSCDHLTQFLDTFKVILERCTVPLRTIHLRMKHFTRVGTYIAPERVYMTRTVEQTRRGPVGEIVVGQFIPTRLLLAKLLSIPGLMKEMKDFQDASYDPYGGECHFMHSPNWHNMMSNVEKEDNVVWLPLHVYFDEFEAGNPLGSRAGKNKIGAVYFSLPSLPHRFVSKIKFIFIMMLFKAKDKGLLQVDTPAQNVVVGNTVFKKVVEELNYLREFGVEVRVSPFETVTVKFLTACLLGDNLGLNQVCGFVESFSSYHCCRVCVDDCRTAPLVENPRSMRNAENYQQALALGDPTTTGIKERCVWLDVKGFDLFANTNPDYMHDFLEGACCYVMYEVILGLTSNLVNFTVSNLNVRIKNFAFGPESNIPGEVKVVKDPQGGGRLRKMSANEIRVFVNYFGLLVGDLLPEDDDLTTVFRGKVVLKKFPDWEARKFYELYLKLIRVQELLTCELVNAGVVASLKGAVFELNTAYLELSSRPHLPPKMHFLIHYPTAMARNGPSISLSSMAFEKKCKDLKRSLTAIASTVNTPLSAAKKIMLQVNSLLTANELPPNTFHPGHLTSVSPDASAELRDVMALPSDALFKETKTIESPTSITYSIGSIICSGFPENEDPCFPKFLKIVKILYCSTYNKAVAVAQPFRTLWWSRHFHAYHVKYIYALDAARNIDLSTLDLSFPNTLCTARDGNDYIFMRNSTCHFTYALE